jgi:hypothetical protein
MVFSALKAKLHRHMDLDPEARILSRASGRQQWEGRGLEFKRLCPKSRVSESAYSGRLKTAQGFRVCVKTQDVRQPSDEYSRFEKLAKQLYLCSEK